MPMSISTLLTLNTQRQRLLKEVVSSSNAQAVVEKPNVKTPFDTQPNLPANILMPLPGADTPMGAKDSVSCLLKGVPMSQEKLLLQELLYCCWVWRAVYCPKSVTLARGCQFC